MTSSGPDHARIILKSFSNRPLCRWRFIRCQHIFFIFWNVISIWWRLRKAHHLVMLECHFSWQVQYLVMLPCFRGRRKIWWNLDTIDSRGAKCCDIPYTIPLQSAKSNLDQRAGARWPQFGFGPFSDHARITQCLFSLNCSCDMTLNRKAPHALFLQRWRWAVCNFFLDKFVCTTSDLHDECTKIAMDVFGTSCVCVCNFFLDKFFCTTSDLHDECTKIAMDVFGTSCVVSQTKAKHWSFTPFCSAGCGGPGPQVPKASAENRARVTSMTTMYSTTRPLMLCWTLAFQGPKS